MIHVGGQSPGAYRRAVARNGWHGFALNPTTPAVVSPGSRRRVQVARPAALGGRDLGHAAAE
jgi:hypothetical protein